MKLVKTASGKQTVKMSKKEWSDIGKKSGWIKEARTVGEVAEEVYNGITFDYALPQYVVDHAREAGFEMRGNFVWVYPKGSFSGQPGPITKEGLQMTKNTEFMEAIGYGLEYNIDDLIDFNKLA